MCSVYHSVNHMCALNVDLKSQCIVLLLSHPLTILDAITALETEVAGIKSAMLADVQMQVSKVRKDMEAKQQDDISALQKTHRDAVRMVRFYIVHSTYHLHGY